MRCRAGEMAIITKKPGLFFIDPVSGEVSPDLVKTGTIVKLKRLAPEIQHEMWEFEKPFVIDYRFLSGTRIYKDVLGICDQFLTPIRPGLMEDELPTTTFKPVKETA